jgi:AGZA family xanthine/uracil permease-like MFS transporter
MSVQRDRLERTFGVRASGSTLRTELRAGLTTFLTMAYVLFVNPDILAQAIPVPDARAQLLTATALAAASGSILMGLLARYPFAQAPGMGLNAYFTFTVVLGQKVSWQAALGAVFVVGLVFALLSQGGVRQAIVGSLPPNLKQAMTAGVGLFLAFIGLKKAGLVVAHPATLVALGPLTSPGPLLAMFGVLVTAVLITKRVPAAILLGIGLTTLLAMITRAPVWEGPGGALAPFGGLGSIGAPVRLPVWPRDLFLALDLRGALRPELWSVLFTMLFVAIFDTAGTLIGLSSEARLLDPRGELPRAGRAFLSDALASSIGALFGSSTTTAYIESAAGIAEGGRTGLCAVVVGVLFLLSTLLWPLLAVVPGVATAPTLILVGALMLSSLRRVDWSDSSETVPVFFTVAGMALTYSIANGVGLGIISYVAQKIGTGQFKRLPKLLVVLAVLLCLRYALIRD